MPWVLLWVQPPYHICILTIGAVLQYLGCYSDTPVRALPFQATNVPTITIPSCHDACVTQGYRYYALEDGLQCYCGNNLTLATMYGSNGAVCNALCAGDSTELCGGYWSFSLFDSFLSSYGDAPVSTVAGVFASFVHLYYIVTLHCFSSSFLQLLFW